MGEAVSAALNEGEIVECTVEQIMPYGAFVRMTANGRKGMIHISELSYSFVKNITDVLNINDKIQAKVIRVDERGRIDLSLKQAQPQPERKERQERRPVSRQNFRPTAPKEFHSTRDYHEIRESMNIPPAGSDESFEEKMSAFLKTSEAKITDLNTRNTARSSRSSKPASRGSKGRKGTREY